jgi:hypothetical protein
MVLEDKAPQDQMLEAQVQRILHSDELRTSEVLRQLLKYLMEKALSGDADQLKEYTVAIDGLGKSSNYDPQHNSAVRIQVGRLRQKLAEYYRGEGKDDTVLIDLPKGRFKLTCELRSTPSSTSTNPVLPPAVTPDRPANNGLQIGSLGFLLWLALTFAVTLCAVLLTLRWSPGAGKSASQSITPELQSLWEPFLDSKRPLVISIEDPLFVELRSSPGIYYRDRSLNRWADVLTSPAVTGIQTVLKNNDIQPSRYYTTFGEANASFLIGKLLGPHTQNISLVKSSQISFQQLADNNVLFVGVQNLFFDEKLQELPIAAQLVPVLEGIRNVHPGPGEPALFIDQYSTAPAEQGVVYALVTRLPGPLGNSDVESFTSNRSAGYLGAVQWFTDPSFARKLVAMLKDSSNGHMPRYYQVLLRVKFKDDVPSETTYVLSRELH